ncbi:hypothetical protein RJ641_027537 [Dillenia turbinata]|uniref:protein-tyrosine-phosphatase n=1 Tax=Dillenia turbinata TaxID=194707 RepID=A0AAN8VYF4_9MAGN
MSCEVEVVSAEKEASPNGEVDRSHAYRCRKCRRVVALQENVLEHVPGEGETDFDWHKRRGGNPFNKSDDFGCSSVFVEPLKWMTAEGGLEGKLSCAHCEARLGYFNWSGIQCSCGSWITPAFQLHKSRVDVSTLLRGAADGAQPIWNCKDVMHSRFIDGQTGIQGYTNKEQPSARRALAAGKDLVVGNDSREKNDAMKPGNCKTEFSTRHCILSSSVN